MKVNEYQEAASGTRQYPKYANVLYPLLGLVGEVGELVEKFCDVMWPFVPECEREYAQALRQASVAAVACETLKKKLRGGTEGWTQEQKKAVEHQVGTIRTTVGSELANESADAIWYVSAILEDLGVTLEEAMAGNIAKLKARKAKNAIHNHKPDSKDHQEVGSVAQ